MPRRGKYSNSTSRLLFSNLLRGEIRISAVSVFREIWFDNELLMREVRNDERDNPGPRSVISCCKGMLIGLISFALPEYRGGRLVP